MADTGVLFLVATPIGNLEDITLRAVRVLSEVDMIAAEDTRQTLKLLNHLNIKKPLVSYYEHNKIIRGNYLIKELHEGKNIALVSDAGTPAISDPGHDLVKLAIENNIKITMLPGAVAAIMGLVLSGLDTSRFVFEGFLPTSKRSKKDRITLLKNEERTIIFYEAPHKLLATLKDLYDILGDRKIVLARELTKKFEEVTIHTLKNAIDIYSEKKPKGEFVLILEGNFNLENYKETDKKNKAFWENMNVLEHVESYLEQGMGKKEAIKKVAADRGQNKREIYLATINKN